MGQAQINVRTRACSGTFIARTKQAALTHNVRGKRLIMSYIYKTSICVKRDGFDDLWIDHISSLTHIVTHELVMISAVEEEECCCTC